MSTNSPKILLCRAEVLSVFALVLVTLGGCSSGASAEMQLLRVSPGRMPLGSETLLTVTGKNLRTSVRIDLDSTTPPEVGHFVAWVGDVGPLTAVTVMDAETLQVVVPGQLGLGLHTVTIRDTLGRAAGVLPNAIEVFEATASSQADAGSPYLADPAVIGATDASVDAMDAGVDSGESVQSGLQGLDAAAGPDAARPCTGAPYGGVCWYLGGAGATCEQTCQAHGGYAPATPSFVGTAGQGGSAAQCEEILGLLGHGQSVIEASRTDVGLGCHLWGVEAQAFWLTAPEFASAAGSGSAQVVCGCNT